MRSTPRVLSSVGVLISLVGCGATVLTAKNQPHVRYPSAPAPEATETAYTRQLRQQLSGAEAPGSTDEGASVEATVGRIYR